jgi:molecular chaperone DnaK
MEEFKDQLDAAEKEKVTTHITELREIATRALGGDESLTAEAIREKIHATQQASLGLFKKVYEKRSAEATPSESSSTEAPKEEKKD